MTIPAFVNSAAGSAQAALEALATMRDCQVAEMPPEALEQALREAIDRGAGRVLVAGGDGTIAAAAAVLAGTHTALAIVPGGTLNHFARDHGIPVAHVDAVRVGCGGSIVAADLGEVNGRVFLNTSSVGAYVLFVRTRERLERRFGYRLASVLAALRILGRVRPFTVELEVDGAVRRYRTPLVFIGVGERELQVPMLGARVRGGARALHVIVVRAGTWRALLHAGVIAALRGIQAISRTALLDSFLVDGCRIEMRRPRGMVAVDGEVVPMTAPLVYRLRREALQIVVPDAGTERES